MLKNNLKSALRDFLKHKTFSLINILGLTVGLTTTMLIGLYVSHEHSYDEFHKDADNIYRFTREFKGQDGTLSLHFSNIASPFGPLLQAEFEPQIESLGRFMTTEVSIRSDRSVFIESNFGFADPEILEVLSFRTTQGVLEDALTQPNAVAITESMSLKYFGEDNPIGKILKYNDERELIVKAVFQGFPANSIC